MTLIPRDSLFDFDSLFNHFLTPTTSKGFNEEFFTPRVDIKESDKGYTLIADLPGVKKDDLSVTLDNGVLTVEASTNEESSEEEDGKVIRKERRSGKFMRSFNLGTDIHEEDISANFADGVLSLTIPKVEKTVPKSRQIDIN